VSAIKSRDIIVELVAYDAASGALTWLHRTAAHFTDGVRTAAEKCARWNGKLAGKAVHLSDRRPIIVFCGHKAPRAHIAFRLGHGHWPVGVIDHIDGNCANDALDNLRDVNVSDNNRNRRTPVNNTSGHIGVHYCRRAKRWIARLVDDHGKKIEVGRSASRDVAIAAWEASPLRNRYHKNHGRPALKPLPAAADTMTGGRPLAGDARTCVTGTFVDQRAGDREADGLGGEVEGIPIHVEGFAA
jgi:hypothetical protein